MITINVYLDGKLVDHCNVNMTMQRWETRAQKQSFYDSIIADRNFSSEEQKRLVFRVE